MIAVLAVLAAAAIILAAIAGHRLLANPGQRAAPRGDILDLPQPSRALLPHKAVDGHPPWQVESAAPLQPLPEWRAEGQRLAEAIEHRPAPILPPGPTADEAGKHAAELFNPPKPQPSHESLGEKWERLFGGALPTVPPEVAEILHWHDSNDDALDSIAFHVLDPERLAMWDAVNGHGHA